MPSAIDMSSINELLALSPNGEVEMVEEIISMYVTDGTDKVNSIETFFNTHDYEKLKMLAHTLKSTSASLGAKSIAEVCRQLEHSAFSESDLPINEKLVGDLKVLFAMALIELLKIRAGLRKAA